MNSGFFFELSEGSDLSRGEILFRYTGLKTAKEPKHPVFLDFNRECVDFYFTGLIEKTKKKKTDEEVSYPEFVENHLFSLNLHKGKENVLQLNESLKDLFDLKFPIIENVVIHEVVDYISPDNNHITYADLDVFPEPKRTNNVTGKKKNGKQEQETESKQKIFYKTLFLDFLFDVYHSDVFENSPAFTQTKQHLDEIPFIQAIKRKAEFYYQVENNEIEKNLITFDSSNSRYIDNLTNAQKDWLEIVQQDVSNKFINKDNRWFEDVETEVKKVFKQPLKKNIFLQTGNERNGNNKEEKEKKKCWKTYRSFLFEQKSLTLKWFIKRNNIIYAWGSFNKSKWGGGIIAFLVVSLVLNIVCLVEDKVYINYSPDITTLFSPVIGIITVTILIVIIFSIVVSFFPKYFPKSKKPRSKKLFIYFFQSLSELFLIPFGILLLTSAFLVFELTSLANKYILFSVLSYKTYLGGSFLVVLFLIIISVILFQLSGSEKILRKNRNQNKEVKENIQLLIFKIVLGIVVLIVLIIYYILPEYYKYLNFLKTLFSIIVFLTVIFFILLNDEKKNHPNLTFATSLRKVFSLLLMGLLFSFFSNLIVIHFEYKDFLDKYNLVDEIWEEAVHPENNIFELTFDPVNVPNFSIIKSLLKEKASARVDAEKEKYFYSSLENLKICSKDGNEFYPVLKKINVNGVKIITLPSVLYINTFLTLLLAVLIQVVLNHRKFLEGGKT